MIVLDTNVVSEVVRPEPNAAVVAWLNQQPAHALYLSAITIAEVNFGLESMPDGKRRQSLALRYGEVFARFLNAPLPFDTAAAAAYGKLAAYAKAAGKGFPPPDAFIAAIAQSRGFAVATRDLAPYLAGGVPVINPWKHSSS